MSSNEYIQGLIENPTERLLVEIKGWIDPSSDRDAAKIIKSCLALRNYGGGYLIIGFNDKTHQPDPAPDYDLREAFGTDRINALVNKYASERFEINVHFPQRDSREFPVLEVAGGVVTPVVTKSSLEIQGDKTAGRLLVKSNTVYVRSMESNGTPSTTEARYQDWTTLVGRCFDNREADIGRFLRRHLGERGAEVERVFASAGESTPNPAVSLLDEGRERLQNLLSGRGLGMPTTGSWEVSACLSRPLSNLPPTQDLLDQLDSANPRYTGWPMWVNSGRFADRDSWPYTLDDGWEALITRTREFWRIEPQGRFYALRSLRDDTTDDPRAPEPGTSLELVLAIRDVAHALGVLLAFCRQLDAPEESVLDVGFRWTGLNGRYLSLWLHPDRGDDMVRVTAVQDSLTSTLRLPIDTPEAALPGYVHAVTSRLFAVFGGDSISERAVEDMASELLSRH